MNPIELQPKGFWMRGDDPKRDWCTDPDNCQRCKAPEWDQHKHRHAGIPMPTPKMVAATAWQPISTAPDDGTRVLTYRAEFGESMAVAWYSHHEGWKPVNGNTWPEPTHWMALPEPPK